jgi:tetrahydromethanopterin S-methyltransferase subunit E
LVGFWVDVTPLSFNGALEETKFFEVNDAVFFCGATAGAATGLPLEEVVFLRGMNAVSGTADVSFALDPVLAVEFFILLDCNVLETSLRLVTAAA